MHVTHISYSDIQGGAARAAYRIHRALLSAGVRSRMEVARVTSGDPTVSTPSRHALARMQLSLWIHIGKLTMRLLKTGNPITHSPAILPTLWPRHLNQSSADVVNLHWIAGEMMSIEDIARIHKPLIWTLHDMWAFCGAEHYTTDERYQSGYRKDNRPSHESGFDLNRWVWERKCRAWRQPIQIVTPSHWLADCVQSSALMHDWPVAVIPYPIDLDTWQPIDKPLARSLLGLPEGGRLLAFGSDRGGRDLRKGFDLLLQALPRLQERLPEISLIVFGQKEPEAPPNLGFPIHYTGRLHDDLSLKIVYSAADAMVIPSRQDNLPNTGLEAMACATPVVAFNTGGLPDIVTHRETGWLAEPFDAEDLARGIEWVLADSQRRKSLQVAAREQAVARFAPTRIAKQYVDLYEQACREKRSH